MAYFMSPQAMRRGYYVVSMSELLIKLTIIQ